jgi:hypothetical protein
VVVAIISARCLFGRPFPKEYLLVEGVDIAERVHHRSLFDTVTTV